MLGCGGGGSLNSRQLHGLAALRREHPGCLGSPSRYARQGWSRKVPATLRSVFPSVRAAIRTYSEDTASAVMIKDVRCTNHPKRSCRKSSCRHGTSCGWGGETLRFVEAAQHKRDMLIADVHRPHHSGTARIQLLPKAPQKPSPHNTLVIDTLRPCISILLVPLYGKG